MRSEVDEEAAEAVEHRRQLARHSLDLLTILKALCVVAHTSDARLVLSFGGGGSSSGPLVRNILDRELRVLASVRL